MLALERNGGDALCSYELADIHVVPIGADGGALTYRPTAQRGDEPPFVALMASSYVLVDGAARLALHQQTTATH